MNFNSFIYTIRNRINILDFLILFGLIGYFLWLGQDFPIEWDDESHFAAVTDSILRGDFPRVSELGANEGILWMPFGSNVLQAFLLKINGFSSVYDVWNIRSRISIPIILSIYIIFKNILVNLGVNFNLARLVVLLFILSPTSSAALNTIRPEALCCLLLLTLINLVQSENYFSSVLISFTLFFVHPLFGFISFISILLFSTICFLFKLDEVRIDYAFIFWVKDKYKYFFLSLFAFIFIFHLHTLLSIDDGFNRLVHDLSFQASRKADRNLLKAFISNGLLISFGSFSFLIGVLYGILKKNKISTAYYSNNLFSLILALPLLVFTKVIGQEMWYELYGLLSILLLLSPYLNTNVNFLYDLVSNKNESLAYRRKLFSLFSIILFMPFIIQSGAFNTSFYGMNIGSIGADYNRERSLLMTRIVQKINPDIIFNTDPYSLRQFNYFSKKYTNKILFRSIPPVLERENQRFNDSPRLIVLSPYPSTFSGFRLSFLGWRTWRCSVIDQYGQSGVSLCSYDNKILFKEDK